MEELIVVDFIKMFNLNKEDLINISVSYSFCYCHQLNINIINVLLKEAKRCVNVKTNIKILNR